MTKTIAHYNYKKVRSDHTLQQLFATVAVYSAALKKEQNDKNIINQSCPSL